MKLTEKQKNWDAEKAAHREERRRPMTANVLVCLADHVIRTGSFYHDPRRARGVRTSVLPTSRPRRECTACPHGWKHHTLSGGCRPGCDCKNGSERGRK